MSTQKDQIVPKNWQNWQYTILCMLPVVNSVLQRYIEDKTKTTLAHKPREGTQVGLRFYLSRASQRVEFLVYLKEKLY